jgi:proline iminopeptidase
MVDQRGAGRSLPLGELEANTTDDLVTDLDTVRQALGITRWLVLGGSWGSLLALAYAQRFPATVSGLLLRGIFLGSRDEIEIYARGLGEYLPAPVPPSPMHALASRILGSQHDAARQAARLWLDYERQLMGEPPMAQLPDPTQQAKARIQMHYLSNDCFLRVDQLLEGIDAIRHLPAVIVQGMADPVCPPRVALRLHEAWPEAIWVPVDGAGHAGLSAPIANACISALDWLATSLDNGWSPARAPLAASSLPGPR